MAEPRIAEALVATSSSGVAPLQRLERTLRLVFALIYGTEAEADDAARRINSVHRRIAQDAEHRRSDATPDDPELMVWVYHSLISSFLLYERLGVARINENDRTQFCVEMRTLGVLLDIDESRLSSSEEAANENIHSRELHQNENSLSQLRMMRKCVADLPMGWQWFTANLFFQLSLASLPMNVRRAYGLHAAKAIFHVTIPVWWVIRLFRPIRARSGKQLPYALAARERVNGKVSMRLRDIVDDGFTLVSRRSELRISP